MEIREATPDDRERITKVTTDSLTASYSLGQPTIENAATEWYGPDEFDDKLDDDRLFMLVAETDDGVFGFSESIRISGRGQGDLLWLHVHPDHRGEGIGSELYERTRERLLDAGVQYLRGRVLADNDMGAEFYRKRGFEKIGEEAIEIDGDRYVEYIFVLPNVDG